jgi:hypothetical protein
MSPYFQSCFVLHKDRQSKSGNLFQHENQHASTSDSIGADDLDICLNDRVNVLEVSTDPCRRLSCLTNCVQRNEVVCDTYIAYSLKQSTGEKRMKGVRRKVEKNIRMSNK